MVCNEEQTLLDLLDGRSFQYPIIQAHNACKLGHLLQTCFRCFLRLLLILHNLFVKLGESVVGLA